MMHITLWRCVIIFIIEFDRNLPLHINYRGDNVITDTLTHSL